MSSVWGAAANRALRNRLSRVGVVVLAILLVLIAFGPLVWTVSPTDQDLTARLSGMSAQHPLGTDTLGRDVLSRILNGGRVSVSLAVLAALASALVGGAIGIVSGYVRGAVDSVLMRIMEIILSFPALILALAISAAAPGAFSPLIVQASLSIGLGLQYIAALGYLGLGVQPPTPEWGAILSDAQTFLLQEPLVLFAPGLIIALAIVSFNLLGDALRDLLDPGGAR